MRVQHSFMFNIQFIKYQSIKEEHFTISSTIQNTHMGEHSSLFMVKVEVYMHWGFLIIIVCQYNVLVQVIIMSVVLLSMTTKATYNDKIIKDEHGNIIEIE